MSKRSNKEHRAFRAALRFINRVLAFDEIELGQLEGCIPDAEGGPIRTVNAASALLLLQEVREARYTARRARRALTVGFFDRHPHLLQCFHCEGPHDPKKHQAGKDRHWAEMYRS